MSVKRRPPPDGARHRCSPFNCCKFTSHRIHKLGPSNQKKGNVFEGLLNSLLFYGEMFLSFCTFTPWELGRIRLFFFSLVFRESLGATRHGNRTPTTFCVGAGLLALVKNPRATINQKKLLGKVRIESNAEKSAGKFHPIGNEPLKLIPSEKIKR